MALRKRAAGRRSPPAQVRGALTAVIRRSIEAPGTFDADGWLRIGFCGHQPGVGETYISTGSLYLCAVGLLPLGLPASDPFWSAPPQPWTSRARLVGPAVPDRSRARVIPGRHWSRRWWRPTMMSDSSSCPKSALRMKPAGFFFEPGRRIQACSTICR